MGRLTAFISCLLAIALASCGGGGGGGDDTGTDTQPDVTDTSSDTAADTAADDAVEEVECSSDGDCDDGDPCTADTCDPDYNECDHDPVDADGDGYAAAEVGGTACAGGTDCLDDLATAFPGAPVVECSPLDNDCNGNPDQDDDGDGHVAYLCTGGDDCDDAAPALLVGECSEVNECCDGCWQVNGCWKDPTNGWLWEDPPMGGSPSWDSAVSYCAGLSLAGHAAGDWRLPTISELRTFIRGCPATESGGACGVIDSCLDDLCNHDCGGCGGGSGPGAGGCHWDPAIEGECTWYWSSSSCAADPSHAWGVQFDAATVEHQDKGVGYFLRCVHPGP